MENLLILGPVLLWILMIQQRYLVQLTVMVVMLMVISPKFQHGILPDLSETLLPPLLHDDEDEAVKIANEEISDFSRIYHGLWLNGMRAKLGMFNEEPEDESIIIELLNIMQNIIRILLITLGH